MIKRFFQKVKEAMYNSVPIGAAEGLVETAPKIHAPSEIAF